MTEDGFVCIDEMKDDEEFVFIDTHKEVNHPRLCWEDYTVAVANTVSLNILGAVCVGFNPAVAVVGSAVYLAAYLGTRRH